MAMTDQEREWGLKEGDPALEVARKERQRVLEGREPAAEPSGFDSELRWKGPGVAGSGMSPRPGSRPGLPELPGERRVETSETGRRFPKGRIPLTLGGELADFRAALASRAPRHLASTGR